MCEHTRQNYGNYVKELCSSLQAKWSQPYLIKWLTPEHSKSSPSPVGADVECH